MSTTDIIRSNTLIFFVNGRKIVDNDVDPSLTLLTYLRNNLHLPGTKLGCGEGGCGACTVMVSKIDRKNDRISHCSVNACLAPVVSLHGLAVTTVEGIGSTTTKLHPVQERLARSHGSQCGFCTPGIIMSMYTLLRNSPVPSMDQIEEYFTGNLCRCTGYRPILEGFRTFTSSAKGCGKKDCCQLAGINDTGNDNVKKDPNVTTVLYDADQFAPYDSNQEIIFPPELKLLTELDEEELEFNGNGITFFRPTNLMRLLQLKYDHPQAKIIVGNTEIGVEVKYKHQHYPVLISPLLIQELSTITDTDNGLEVGAAVTLTTLQEHLKTLITIIPDEKTGVFKAIIEMLKWFAGRQIRNTAAIGGNIMTGSPISDLNPIFMASGTILTLKSIDGERQVKLDNNFFTGYRRNIVEPKELLTSVCIPFTQKGQCFMAYKQARRRDDDIAIVNCGLSVILKPGTAEILKADFAWGGMAPTTVMAPKTMQLLKGRQWNDKLLEEATDTLLQDLPLSPSAPGGMVAYRRALTLSLFLKFYWTVRDKLSGDKIVPPLSKKEQSVTESYERPPSCSTQLFQKVENGQSSLDPIGRPINHVSADQQTTGEAVYIDDIPRYNNELIAAFVLSSKAKAAILSIDFKDALDVPGVHSIISSKDLQESRNKFGMLQDEEIFASSSVEYVGQIIAVVLADDQAQAQKASRLVKVEYQETVPPIITLEQAMENESFFCELNLKKGDAELEFKSCVNVLEGEIHIGGQEHFYMETNAHIAVPHENGEIELISSTQNPTDSQTKVSKALGVPAHKVVVKVKRLGGGFGGKETRTVVVSLPIAVAAAKIGRPVRIMLDRDEDMLITGTRHPFHGKWKVGFDNQGVIQAAHMDLYSNGGYSLDLSRGVLERAVFSVDNAYDIKNFSIRGRACKTNLASNTAFRGFGAPQGILVMEDAVHTVSHFLKLDANMVREKNMYGIDGGITPFHQTVTQCTLKRCWKDVFIQSKYEEALKEVNTFNSQNKYEKRGISAVPVKFGISFTVPKLNQGSALLLVYIDGSVLISHGGTEMGQGLHTKIIQVACHTLGIESKLVYVAETATDKVANSSPTAASASSDIYGDAVLKACQEINERLAPYKNKMRESMWVDWVNAAYEDRVSLSSIGFHKTPNIIPVDQKTLRGNPFNYFSYGTAVSVVQIDCLTGHHTVLSSDIVMDVGTSLNPAIDIGQIEGAFVQGMGLFTMEELLYTPGGTLLTRGPGAYKIPGFQDIPCKFNVSLLRDAPNPRAVYSSKAVGEPPLFLAASVFFAIKNAIRTSRENNGVTGCFRLDSPATVERIRMACRDQITTKLDSSSSKEPFKPWAVIV